jgi:hypothetical protein
VYGEAGLRRLAAEQKAKLLPQLREKRNVLVGKMSAATGHFKAEIADVDIAIGDIEAGRITDYQFRRKAEKDRAEE